MRIPRLPSAPERAFPRNLPLNVDKKITWHLNSQTLVMIQAWRSFWNGVYWIQACKTESVHVTKYLRNRNYTCIAELSRRLEISVIDGREKKTSKILVIERAENCWPFGRNSSRDIGAWYSVWKDVSTSKTSAKGQNAHACDKRKKNQACSFQIGNLQRLPETRCVASSKETSRWMIPWNSIMLLVRKLEPAKSYTKQTWLSG